MPKSSWYALQTRNFEPLQCKAIPYQKYKFKIYYYATEWQIWKYLDTVEKDSLEYDFIYHLYKQFR